MLKHETMTDFKKKFESETGIKLDFRVMAYLNNKDGNYPIYDQAIAVQVIGFLESYLNDYVLENRGQYSDFDGFELKQAAELKKAKAGTLKQYIEGYITELHQRKSSAKKQKRILDRGDALLPSNVLMKDSDARLAVKIGRGNKSLGVRLALREYKL